MGWMTEMSEFESQLGEEFSLHVVQTGSVAHPASYPIGSEGSFAGVKLLGHEADHSSPTSAEVRRMCIYTSTPPYAFST
jgi:hypothetical protein